MCHIGNAPGDLSVLVDTLRPGDILTHPYSALGNNTVQNGKVLPALLEAKKRGVIIDVGHGAGSFDYDIAEEAIQQGLVFDTISSDVHAAAANTPSRPYLPWVLSKFLALGFSLDQVIAAATIKPANVINCAPSSARCRSARLRTWPFSNSSKARSNCSTPRTSPAPARPI